MAKISYTERYDKTCSECKYFDGMTGVCKKYMVLFTMDTPACDDFKDPGSWL
ncbi:MAG: hypothetical protein ACOC4M_08190 [Promethearchaeia archaeon]